MKKILLIIAIATMASCQSDNITNQINSSDIKYNVVEIDSCEYIKLSSGHRWLFSTQGEL